jgi:hypothetical protein
VGVVLLAVERQTVVPPDAAPVTNHLAVFRVPGGGVDAVVVPEAVAEALCKLLAGG